nr:immunoglobulin heavy chain junction region [Mus musculus]
CARDGKGAWFAYW